MDWILDFVSRHFNQNRSHVSHATNAATMEVAEVLGGSLLRFECNSQCLDWIIPPLWDVKRATLIAPDGHVLADYRESPMRLWAYSTSFSGTVSLEQLMPHLFHDIFFRRPKVIPYHHRNGYRPNEWDWGFSLTLEEYENLKPGSYKVEIETVFDNDAHLNVADTVVPGKLEDTILFTAHTCHPGQVSDGLANVALLTELFKKLALRETRYSYRFVTGPEYYCAAAFLSTLSHAEINSIKGVVSVDLAGGGGPLGFQHSFQGDSLLDRIVAHAFKARHADYLEKDFRRLCGNDEVFYNGVGFMIPSVGLGCYRGDYYHSHLDNLENFDRAQVDLISELIEYVIEILERDYRPKPLFKGVLQLSRHELYIDPLKDRLSHDIQNNIQYAMHHGKTCFEMAEENDVTFDRVYSFLEVLRSRGLIEKEPESGR